MNEFAPFQHLVGFDPNQQPVVIEFGQRVQFTWTLHRKRSSEHDSRGRWYHMHRWVCQRWETEPEPKPTEGIVIGVRTLADGTVTHNYDSGSEFKPTRHFRAYLIAYDMRRKPVLVLPDYVHPILSA